jgi:hypothetical protein
MVCRSVVVVGTVHASMTRSPLRVARRSDGGLGNSSDGGCGGVIDAHAESITSDPNIAAVKCPVASFMQKHQPTRTECSQRMRAISHFRNPWLGLVGNSHGNLSLYFNDFVKEDGCVAEGASSQRTDSATAATVCHQGQEFKMRPGGARIDRRTVIKMAGVGVIANFTAADTLGTALSDRKASAAAVSPLQTEFVYEALVTLDPAIEIGPSADGIRRYIPIKGGPFSGPRISGVVLPGGADWQVDRPDGVTELDALYSIKASDGAVIVVHNRGLFVDGGKYFRTTPQFQAPRGPHDWLNKSIFAGSVAGAPQPGAVVVRVFRVL